MYTFDKSSTFSEAFSEIFNKNIFKLGFEQQVSSFKDDVKLKIQYLTQIVELSKVALSKINQDELFIYFGIKKHEKANENLQN